MKKRMIFITLTLLITAIGISVYLAHRPPPLFSVQEEIPESKMHEHTAPDGSTVQHTHTYDFATPDIHTKNTVKQEQALDTKHPIQRAWERLDLAAIKEKYQPYTVSEMKEMWYNDYLVYGITTADKEAAVEELYPHDEWLKVLMDLGHPFINSGHYDLALNRRRGLTVNVRKDWDRGDPRLLKRKELPSDTSWDEYIEMYNKFSVVRLMNVLQAQEIDPDVDGGVTSLDGSFLPFSPNLVNVHIDPKTGRTKFIGPRLTAAEEDALVNFGVAPEGMSVVYIDANDKPIPVGKVVPCFFERNMKELETAQSMLHQQIEEHEFLLEMDKLLDTPEAKKEESGIPPENGHEQDPSHTHERPKDAEASPPQRPNIDINRLPPGVEFPSDLRTPDAVSQWFRQLETLHGGELPKDLRALREVITKLEKVRQDAKKHQKPPPRPERPTPSEGSPTPPDANE